MTCRVYYPAADTYPDKTEDGEPHPQAGQVVKPGEISHPTHMGLELKPGVFVDRDEEGNVTFCTHPNGPATPAAASITLTSTEYGAAIAHVAADPTESAAPSSRRRR
jgi:hypothetical protein